MVAIRSPLSASIQIDSICNLRCKYCYSYPFSGKYIPFDSYINLLRDLKEREVFEVLIEGGEPFLHPEIFKIIESSAEIYPSLSILSNGTLIDGKAVQKILKIKERHPGLSFQISLDSHIEYINNKTRGLTKKVVDAVNLLANVGVDVATATVVTKYNLAHLIELVLFFYPAVKKFHFMNLMPTKLSLENYTDLFIDKTTLDNLWQNFVDNFPSLPRDVVISTPINDYNLRYGRSTAKCDGCLAGTTRVSIDTDLNVIACPIAKNKVLGNLGESKFEEIWFSPEAENIRKYPYPLCCGE